MLSIYLAGLMMWLIYGVLLKATAVVVANAASAALVAAAIAMKATIRARDLQESSGESSQIVIRPAPRATSKCNDQTGGHQPFVAASSVIARYAWSIAASV